MVRFVYYSIMGDVVGCWWCTHDDENLPAGMVATTTHPPGKMMPNVTHLLVLLF